jgi:TRAP-type C4-dicarboxylate transport system substrate-binding protein
MFRKVRFGWVVALVLVASAAVSAQALRIRLGTIVPEASPWIEALKSMGQRWSAETGKRVEFRAVGSLTSETSVIQRMGTAGLEAGALSVVGLAEIDPAFNALAIPFFFNSDAEFRHVLDQLTPLLTARLAAKKYRLVLWGHGGWVQIFSKHPIRTMADLQRAKLFTSEGSPETVRWYTANGFHPVPLAAGEIPKQLKLLTGAIDATPAVPPLALTMQFYKDAKYMLEVRVAPLVAGVVMTDAAWNRLSAEDRTRMWKAAEDTQNQLFSQASSLDASHIKEMQASGLQVITLDAAAAAQFRAAAEKLAATQRGSMIPADVYDAVLRERDAYRKTRK